MEDKKLQDVLGTKKNVPNTAVLAESELMNTMMRHNMLLKSFQTTYENWGNQNEGRARLEFSNLRSRESNY